MCRWLVLGALTASALLTTTRARAERVLDEWEAPPECPDRERAELRIADVASGRPLAARARVNIVRAGDGTYRAQLTIPAKNGARHERILRAETCDLVVDAAAVVFVASQAEDYASVASEPTATPAPEPAPTKRSPWAFWIAGRPVVDHGLLPETAFGGALDLAIGTDTVRGEIRLTGLAPSTGVAPAGATGEIHAFAADPAVCAARSIATLRLGACVGVTVAWLRGRGAEVENPREESRFVPAPKLGFDLRWPARGTIAARLDALARVAVARPEFVVLNEGVLHRPSLFSVQLAVGPEVRF